MIMFVVPLFDSDNYVDKAESWDFTLGSISHMLEDTAISIDTISSFISKQIEDRKEDNYVVYFSTPFEELPTYEHEEFANQRIQDVESSLQAIDLDKIQNLRPTLTLRANLGEVGDNEIYAVMSYRYNNQRDASTSFKYV